MTSRRIRGKPLSVCFDRSLNWEKEEEKSIRGSQLRHSQKLTRQSKKPSPYMKLASFLKIASGNNGDQLCAIVDEVSGRTFLSLVAEAARSLYLMSGLDNFQDTSVVAVLSAHFQRMEVEGTMVALRLEIYMTALWMKIAVAEFKARLQLGD
jgi:hypothetical protein